MSDPELDLASLLIGEFEVGDTAEIIGLRINTLNFSCGDIVTVLDVVTFNAALGRSVCITPKMAVGENPTRLSNKPRTWLYSRYLRHHFGQNDPTVGSTSPHSPAL